MKNLNPAYFALVMATGIVSIAVDLMGMTLLAKAMFWFNIAAYLILWVLTLWRIARYPRAVGADFLDHTRCGGFFTIVVATCVLGSQCLVLFRAIDAAIAFGVAGLILWAGLTYTIFTILTVKKNKPTLAEGINGGWLLAVVATQAVSVILSQWAGARPQGHDPALFLSLVMWLGGGMLYIWMISLIFYRYTFFTFKPSDLSPPYWINMGAVAITTLAGAFLILAAPRAPFLAALVPFLKGFTLFFWATATWWIPMLLILGFWRHVYNRFPLRYDPLYWGVVFPLGMYTAATWRLEQVITIPFLQWVPRVFVWIALAAWVVVFIGLLKSLLRAGRAQAAG